MHAYTVCAHTRAREAVNTGGDGVLERELERKLRDEIRKAGGECLKWVSPGYTGVPDRIVLASGGRICFVEMKAPGKTERPRQRIVQQHLREMGFTVFSSVDSADKIRDVIEWVEGGDA